MEEKIGNKTNTMVGNRLLPIASGILAVVVITMSVLYGMESGKLNEANRNISNLEEQLTTEKAHVADLQAQLIAANTKATSLTTALVAADTKATSLTTDLAAANIKATSLTTDLTAANTRITTLITDLTAANTRISTLITDLATANATYRKVASPRHFLSVQELTDWLAKDDTNNNTTYAGLRNSEKAYILQIKALRDGLLLPASLTWLNGVVYNENIAIIGGTSIGASYSVDVATDRIGLKASVTPYSTYPLPLP